MTITIEHFNTLNKTEQHELIWSGICIGFRKESEYKILIYKISDFYVEIFYNKVLNHIKKIEAIPTIKAELIPGINPSTLYE